jgi:hypothetical protein
MECTSWRISEETALFGRDGLISICSHRKRAADSDHDLLTKFVPFSPRSPAISVNAFKGIEACSLRNQKTTFRLFIRMRLPNYLDDRTMDNSRARQPRTAFVLGKLAGHLSQL